MTVFPDVAGAQALGPATRRMPWATARQVAGDAATPLPAETRPLGDAVGYALAAPLTTLTDLPAFDTSAMDGWAVREADLELSVDEGSSLRIQGESAAGKPYGGVLEPGGAVRVFTGARVPDGADRVVIQEEARREGDRVLPSPPPGSPAHIRRRGGDFAEGAELLPTGARLDAWRLSLAASAGAGEVAVAPRPRLHRTSMTARSSSPSPFTACILSPVVLQNVVLLYVVCGARPDPPAGMVLVYCALLGGNDLLRRNFRLRDLPLGACHARGWLL